MTYRLFYTDVWLTEAQYRSTKPALIAIEYSEFDDALGMARDINASGTAVVMATHDLDLVRQAPYRVIELQEGALVYDSAVDEARDQAAAP